MKNNILIEKNQHPHDILMSNKYDWIAIRQEYVEGIIDNDNNHTWPTMKNLSIKYAIPHAYLRRIASIQKWTEEKQNFITNYEHAKRTERIKFLTKKSIKFDSNCIDIAEEGIEKIKNAIFNADRVVDENGIKILFSIEDLDLLAKTLEKFQKIGRLALGSSTDNVSKMLVQGIESIPFAEGLSTVMKQVESNPDLLKKIESEFID